MTTARTSPFERNRSWIFDVDDTDYDAWFVVVYPNADGSLRAGTCVGRGLDITVPSKAYGEVAYVLVVNSGLDFGLGLGGHELIFDATQLEPPANDTAEGAIDVSETSYYELTFDATSSALEASLAASCTPTPPSTAGVGVWFKFATDKPWRFSAVSDYGAWMIVVYPNQDGSMTAGPCGPDVITVPKGDGQTAYILVVGAGDGSGAGLTFSSRENVPPPQIDVTVDPTGSVNTRTGVVTVRGTFTCNHANTVGASVDELTQTVGRFKFTGSAMSNADSYIDPCDGQSHPWTATVSSASGKFAGGKATITVSAWAYNPYDEYSTDYVTQVIQLKAGK